MHKANAMLHALKEINIEVEESTTALYDATQATFPTHQSILGIIHPAHAGEVCDCLRLAREYQIPVFPISRGKNWGYGSRVPATSGGFVISLARLNHILQYDEALAFVRIEPGVSFEALNEFLRAKGGMYEIQIPGSTPEASVVGNILERGLTADGEKTHQAGALKILLPDGEWLETGFGNFPSALAASLHPWGLGPSADGLFFQSNLGIVMELTLWLKPIPSCTQQLTFSISSLSALALTLDQIRQLKLRNQINGVCSVHSVPKVLSLASQYPFKESQNQTPLPEPLLQAASRLLSGEWMGEIEIYGEDRRILSIQEEIIRHSLTAVTHQIQAQPTNTPVQNPTSGIRHAYWRKPDTMPSMPNPDRDRCGLIWHCPVIPLIGEYMTLAILSAQKILSKYRFEAMISIQIPAIRYAYLVISIVYDRNKPGEDDNAMRCYEELVADSSKNGYFPYRLGIQSMNEFACTRKDRQFWQKLKDLLDPDDILAPGRYILSKERKT
ncbi:MAG: FAD-binding oxidoreductase [Bacteroidia bacterium]